MKQRNQNSLRKLPQNLSAVAHLANPSTKFEKIKGVPSCVHLFKPDVIRNVIMKYIFLNLEEFKIAAKDPYNTLLEREVIKMIALSVNIDKCPLSLIKYIFEMIDGPIKDPWQTTPNKNPVEKPSPPKVNIESMSDKEFEEYKKQLLAMETFLATVG